MGIERVDVLVIGAGVVGLACAHALTRRFESVAIVERGSAPGQETSSRNSGVIHAGLYYREDSLKTRLCIEGKEALYRWCEANEVPHARTGKLIVATRPEEVEMLSRLAAHAGRVGAGPLVPMSAAEVARSEPEVRCEAALFSPTSGIVDVHELVASLVRRLREAEAALVFQTRVQAIARRNAQWFVRTEDTLGRTGELRADRVVNAAGLSSLQVADASGLVSDERPWRLFPCKGSYFSLGPGAPRTNHSLIYPLPQGAGLGVHITADLGGARRAGPDAQYVDIIEYDVDPSGAERFAQAISQYLPGIRAEDLSPDYAGVRPKLVGPGGGFMDFVIATPPSQPRMIHLIGIESPGLTAALAIGDHVSMLCA